MKILIFIVATVYATAAVNKKAIVVLKASTSTVNIDGTVTFTQTEDGVKVEGTINGVPTGHHGFHVHEKGDLSGGCKTASGHFNPAKKNHGDRLAEERHVGDLGNIVADDQKVAKFSFVDKLISLDGANNIIGRAVVLHADEDDLGKGGHNDSLTTGHAGDRLACGVIGIFDEVPNGVPFFASSILTLSSAIIFSAIYNLLRL